MDRDGYARVVATWLAGSLVRACAQPVSTLWLVGPGLRPSYRCRRSWVSRRSFGWRVRDRCATIRGMRFVEVDGARVSVIGLGCWQFGSSDWGYGDDYARHEAGVITERALDLGINLV